MLVVVANLLADLIYLVLDPRVRVHTRFRFPRLRRVPQPGGASQPAQTLS